MDPANKSQEVGTGGSERWGEWVKPDIDVSPVDLYPGVRLARDGQAGLITKDGCSAFYTTKREGGVSDGARTRDNWNHNPGLYQLSYAHHTTRTYHKNGTPGRTRTCYPRLRRPMLYPDELQAHSGRGRGIRTPDILLPKQARYQTALYPVIDPYRSREASY